MQLFKPTFASIMRDSGVTAKMYTTGGRTYVHFNLAQKKYEFAQSKKEHYFFFLCAEVWV